MSLIKSLRARLPASSCFLDKEELQPLCSLVNTTTKNISEDLLDAETTIVKSIVVSSKLPDVLLNGNIRLNLDQFLKWFWEFNAAFPTVYLLLSAGITVGVSTAICEASFSSVVRILTSYRRSMSQGRINHWAHRANARGLALGYQSTLMVFHVFRPRVKIVQLFDYCV